VEKIGKILKIIVFGRHRSRCLGQDPQPFLVIPPSAPRPVITADLASKRA
jgi:hypothetical protein